MFFCCRFDNSVRPTCACAWIEQGRRVRRPAGAVAVAWVLQRPGVDGAIVGFRQPAQTDTILAADSLELTADELAEIEA